MAKVVPQNLFVLVIHVEHLTDPSSPASLADDFQACFERHLPGFGIFARLNAFVGVGKVDCVHVRIPGRVEPPLVMPRPEVEAHIAGPPFDLERRRSARDLVLQFHRPAANVFAKRLRPTPRTRSNSNKRRAEVRLSAELGRVSQLRHAERSADLSSEVVRDFCVPGNRFDVTCLRIRPEFVLLALAFQVAAKFSEMTKQFSLLH
jgi:hypothetical protein